MEARTTNAGFLIFSNPTHMEPLTLHILGCGSARPTHKHNPSSQVLDCRGKLFMIDCGEGTQVAFTRNRLNMNRLGHIFISHNHGDHVFGLPGLVCTMSLMGRTADLHIHAPADVKPLLEMVEQHYCECLGYKLVFHPVDTAANTLVHEDRSLEVWSLPLRHRVPCCGYLFREKPLLPHIRRDMIDAFHIPFSQINNIKNGSGWTTPDGTFLPHEKLTTPADPPRSFAYCSDTLYMPALAPLLKDVTLLYHEATYTSEMEQRAKQNAHSTAAQAARIAQAAQASRLCIGHYSACIDDENALLQEARAIFPRTILAREGMQIHL